MRWMAGSVALRGVTRVEGGVRRLSPGIDLLGITPWGWVTRVMATRLSDPVPDPTPQFPDSNRRVPASARSHRTRLDRHILTSSRSSSLDYYAIATTDPLCMPSRTSGFTAIIFGDTASV